MSTDAVALVAGTLLAIGALAYVLYPLFFSSHVESSTAVRETSADDSAVVALREIEFDRATGKLSEADYSELRRIYAERAVREMRGVGAAEVEVGDPIEARIRAYRHARRECPTCGLRPELDAVYCSSCGTFLERRCPDCGAEIEERSATFCSTCGGRLDRRAYAARR